MAKKDIALKTWLKNKERFADFFNGVVFNGKQTIKPRELEEAYGESDIIATDKKGTERAFNRYRDVVMRWRGGVNLAILAIENQTRIDYTMPVRSMLYDAMSYDEQLRVVHTQKGAKGNYLKSFGKNDSIYPVITVIFYYGDRPWKDNKELHNMFKNIDKELYENFLKEYVPNYKLNILDANNVVEVDKFQTDLQIVLGMIKYKKDNEGLERYVHKHKKYFKNVEKDSIDVITAIMEMEQLKEYIPNVEEGERVDMCKALQDMCKKNRDAGIETGRKEGIRSIVVNMIRKGLSTEDICDLAQCETEYVEELRETLV